MTLLTTLQNNIGTPATTIGGPAPYFTYGNETNDTDYINLPGTGGVPGSLTVGDLILAYYSSDTYDDITLTTPGWTKVTSIYSDFNGQWFGVWQKLSDGTETTISYAGTAYSNTHCILVYRGCDSTTPITGFATYEQGYVTTPVNIPAGPLDILRTNSTLVSAAATDTNVSLIGQTYTAPTGFTKRAEEVWYWQSIMVSDYVQTATGSTGVITPSTTLPSATTIGVSAILLSLQPVEASGTEYFATLTASTSAVATKINNAARVFTQSVTMPSVIVKASSIIKSCVSNCVSTSQKICNQTYATSSTVLATVSKAVVTSYNSVCSVTANIVNSAVKSITLAANSALVTTMIKYLARSYTASTTLVAIVAFSKSAYLTLLAQSDTSSTLVKYISTTAASLLLPLAAIKKDVVSVYTATLSTVSVIVKLTTLAFIAPVVISAMILTSLVKLLILTTELVLTSTLIKSISTTITSLFTGITALNKDIQVLTNTSASISAVVSKTALINPTTSMSTDAVFTKYIEIIRSYTSIASSSITKFIDSAKLATVATPAIILKSISKSIEVSLTLASIFTKIVIITLVMVSVLSALIIKNIILYKLKNMATTASKLLSRASGWLASVRTYFVTSFGHGGTNTKEENVVVHRYASKKEVRLFTVKQSATLNITIRKTPDNL